MRNSCDRIPFKNLTFFIFRSLLFILVSWRIVLKTIMRTSWHFVPLLFRLQHELQEKDKVIKALELSLHSTAEVQSVALSPFPSPTRQHGQTQTSPSAHAKGPLKVTITTKTRQWSHASLKARQEKATIPLKEEKTLGFLKQTGKPIYWRSRVGMMKYY